MRSRIFLLLFASLCSLGILEVVFRWYGHVQSIDYRLYDKELTNSERLPSNLFIPSDLTDYKLNPGAQELATTSDFSLMYRISNSGHRDKEYSTNVAVGNTRFIAVGDSFTFGEGVPEGKRFTDLAEEKIPNIEIINMGVPGYGFDKLVMQIRTNAYDTNYVLIFLNQLVLDRIHYETNDLPNTINQVSVTVPSETKSTVTTAFISREEADKLQTTGIVSRSYLLSYLNYHRKLRSLHSDFANYDKELWSSLYPQMSKEHMQASQVEEVYGPKIDRNALLIQAVVNTCNQKSCKPIFVNIDNKKLPLNFPTTVHYIDLSDAIQGYGRDHPLSFKYDPHYNPETHAFIGEKLTEEIQKVLGDNGI